MPHIHTIKTLYKTLHLKYGRPEGQWVLWCRRPKTIAEKEEVVIGAILTQRTNWRNVQLSIEKLKENGITSLQDIYNLDKKDLKKLGELIKSSGFYQSKARYLFNIARFFVKNGGIEKVQELPQENLRESLLNLEGVGKETADSILLYALEKPIFVIDEYTRRLVKKENLTHAPVPTYIGTVRGSAHEKRVQATNSCWRSFTGKLSYDQLQELFENNLEKDYKLYQDFHALVVIDGKNNNQKK